MKTLTKTKKWTLTDEHKRQIPAWNARWESIIMSTTSMTEEDKRLTRDAIRGMYEAAKLPTDDLRIVFVKSPLMAAVVAGAAAACWQSHGTPATARAATDATAAAPATARAATDATATARAARAATAAATAAAARATDAATARATDAATAAATDATARATDARATATAAANGDVFTTILRAALSVVGDTSLARSCVEQSWNMRNGGNHWAAWCCYLSFVRDIVGFDCEEHAQYAHYEAAAIHSSWRYSHPKFCIVSDKPTTLKTEFVNGAHRAHCEDGPSHAWSDGWKLWHIRGLRVDEQVVLRPETQTLEQISRETNEDVRTIRIERFAGCDRSPHDGWTRYLLEIKAECLDETSNEIEGTREAVFALPNGGRRLMATCPTGRIVCLGLPPSVNTCEQARTWLAGSKPFRILART